MCLQSGINRVDFSVYIAPALAWHLGELPRGRLKFTVVSVPGIHDATLVDLFCFVDFHLLLIISWEKQAVYIRPENGIEHYSRSSALFPMQDFMFVFTLHLVPNIQSVLRLPRRIAHNSINSSEALPTKVCFYWL